MKISLSITTSYQIRSYYENQDDNKLGYIDPNELEKNGTSLLLLNTIKKMFNVIKNPNDTYSDITEVHININAGGDFELGSFPEILESTPIINIKKVGDQTIKEFNVHGSLHSISFEGGLFHNLQFQDIKCDSLKFSEVTIEKTILFKKVQGINKLTFDSCKGTIVSDEVTRLEFDECNGIKQLDLIRTSFGYISIVDSEINNIFPYKIHFDKVEHIGSKNAFGNIIKDNGKLKNSLIEIKDYYRQLKYSHDQIGNKTEANKFFAKEMEYHMKSLEEAKDWKNYGIALIQKRVSDFGQDWVRAFLVYLGLIFIGFIFYQIYQVSDPKLIFDYSYEGFKNGVVDFTKLANPLPKVEDINNPVSLLFSIAKILIVYQIVVALRRISQR